MHLTLRFPWGFGMVFSAHRVLCWIHYLVRKQKLLINEQHTNEDTSVSAQAIFARLEICMQVLFFMCFKKQLWVIQGHFFMDGHLLCVNRWCDLWLKEKSFSTNSN